MNKIVLVLICMLASSFANASSDAFKAAKFAELQEKAGRDLTDEEMRKLSALIDLNNLTETETEAKFQLAAAGVDKVITKIFCVGAKGGAFAIGGGGGLCMDDVGSAHIVTFGGVGAYNGLAGEVFVLFVNSKTTVKGNYIGVGAGQTFDVIGKIAGILNIAPTIFGADVKAFSEINPLFGKRGYNFDGSPVLTPTKADGNTVILVGLTAGKVLDVTATVMNID